METNLKIQEQLGISQEITAQLLKVTRRSVIII